MKLDVDSLLNFSVCISGLIVSNFYTFDHWFTQYLVSSLHLMLTEGLFRIPPSVTDLSCFWALLPRDLSVSPTCSCPSRMYTHILPHIFLHGREDPSCIHSHFLWFTKLCKGAECYLSSRLSLQPRHDPLHVWQHHKSFLWFVLSALHILSLLIFLPYLFCLLPSCFPSFKAHSG